MALTYSSAEMLLAAALGAVVAIAGSVSVAENVKEDATKEVEFAIKNCEAVLPRGHTCVPLIRAVPATSFPSMFLPQAAPETEENSNARIKI